MSTKDAGLRIRVERELREAFVMACAADKRKASDVLREFMSAYVRRNPDGKQTNLFDSGDVMTIGAARKKE